MKVSAILLLTLLVSTQAAGWGVGWCPTVTRQSNFDVVSYMGTWYERARVKNIKFESGDCVTAEYSLNDDNTVKVINSQNINGEDKPLEGEAYCEADNSGQCYVRFSKTQPWGDYEVLSTDYETYTIIYSCTSLFVANYKIAWVLARDPTFDPTQAVAALKGLGFASTDFYYTKQNCE